MFKVQTGTDVSTICIPRSYHLSGRKLYQTGLNRDVRAENTLLSIIGIRIVVIQELLNKVGKREIGEEVKKIGGVGLRHSDHPEKVIII